MSKKEDDKSLEGESFSMDELVREIIKRSAVLDNYTLPHDYYDEL